ncbi:putative Sedlin, N-terminal region protein [Cardiosporidium cionae]|uniref:Sedlin, N-terminal region protein n=1 Tax=Cardiosporidium cionae TaxID=476202 RepID=A0ABQ7JFL4_9APIC|nr:putative Sedlin, N-terminal region protein [Cardiosporidium cionae]|eukprot:KAF8822761.1 putative Sedlin, N-terminal region protein [Cardiosporidium cionae]
MEEIGFVAIIGKMNEPLLFQAYNLQDEQELRFAAYAALDLIDPKGTALNKCGSSAIADPYLGYMCPVLCFGCDYELYGLSLPTGFKIIVALKEHSKQDETTIRKVY